MSNLESQALERGLCRLSGVERRKELPDLIKYQSIQDLGSGLFYDDYAFRKDDGRFSSVRIARGTGDSPSDLLKALRSRGAILPMDTDASRKPLIEARDAKALQNRQAACHNGWSEEKDHFVCLSGRIANSVRKSSSLLPPLISGTDPRIAPETAGSSSAWVQEIGKAASTSSIIALVLAAGFACPILRIVGIGSFMLNLHGPSRAGKSTATMALGSMIGFGAEDRLPNWNQTSAAAEETATSFNDHPLPMNELALSGDPPKARHEKLKSIIYSLGEGAQKKRHQSFEVDKSSSNGWRTIIVTNSEHSFNAIAERAGQVRDDGECVRAIDVPVLIGDCQTIFDRVPAAHDNDKERHGWIDRRLTRLRASCAANQGTVFDDYVGWLIDQDSMTLSTKIQSLMKEYVTSAPQIAGDRVWDDVSRRFGVIYAGGILAIEAKLLPIKPATLKRSILKCQNGALQHRSHKATLQEKALATLKRNFVKESWPAVLELNSSEEARTFRFFQDKTSETPAFAVKSKVFSSWFSDKMSERLALKWLYENKLLAIQPRHQDGICDLTLEGATKFVRIGEKSRNVRCIVFQDPRPLWA